MYVHPHTTFSARGLDATVAARLVREIAHTARVAHIAGRVARADVGGGTLGLDARVATRLVREVAHAARVACGAGRVVIRADRRRHARGRGRRRRGHHRRLGRGVVAHAGIA